MKKIVIIDYGMGNLGSVKNAIKSLGGNCLISNNKKEIVNADAIIMPGMGAFDVAMKNLDKLNLINFLNEMVLVKKKKYLGICLGMQLLASVSEEGGLNKGLNWIPSKIKKINSDNNKLIPHVGWNNISVSNNKTKLLDNCNGKAFYFDHSYHFDCSKKYISAYFSYDLKYVAAVNYNNIFGTQFHPERSSKIGLTVLNNFINLI